MIVSGNGEYGLASAIKEKYPEAMFASRSNDWKLQKEDDQDRFAKETLNHDVYISCSTLHSFNQVKLLEKVINAWVENEHAGRIVVMGSSADTPVKGTKWIYPIEKKALKAYCRNLGNLCSGGHSEKPINFRITYLSVGHLNTIKANDKHPYVDKLDLNYVTEVISWLLAQPLTVNINEMSIDPVQLKKN
jgi:hypothetical protein